MDPSVRPLGHIFLSALAAAVPIAFLFWALAVQKVRGPVAGLSTTGLTILVARPVWQRLRDDVPGGDFVYDIPRFPAVGFPGE